MNFINLIFSRTDTGIFNSHFFTTASLNGKEGESGFIFLIYI